jgi:hypothetical protein
VVGQYCSTKCRSEKTKNPRWWKGQKQKPSSRRQSARGTRTTFASEHHLYRAFDGDGRLLYVGISLNALNRLSEHKRSSGWFGHVARVEVEHMPSREFAASAEIHAIRTERPLWNVTHNSPDGAPLVWREAAA